LKYCNILTIPYII